MFRTILAAAFAIPVIGATISGCRMPAPNPSRESGRAAERGSEPIDSLRARLTARVATLRGQVPTAVVGIAWTDLADGRRLDIAGDTVFHAASTMKVPVMIQLMRLADAGTLSLDQPILLENRFRSIVDGSPYSLDARDDSDSSAYALVGTRVALRELMRRMIVRSSNLSTNALIALADPTRVTATATALGATHTRVLRGVEDNLAFQKALNNVTTARDLAALLEAIERGTAASRARCNDMRDVLLAQELDAGSIPAGLPAGTPVAHKSGQITATLHDAGIVYPRGAKPYVLVVLTRGIPDEAVAQATIADVSRIVYAFAR